MRKLSTYRFCQAVLAPDGTMMLTDREPFRFQPLADNIAHPARAGDTWWGLAVRYYGPARITDRPADLWRIIADFQPQPVVDPTLKIEPGSTVYVPSVQTLLQRIFNRDRRVAHR